LSFRVRHVQQPVFVRLRDALSEEAVAAAEAAAAAAAAAAVAEVDEDAPYVSFAETAFPCFGLGPGFLRSFRWAGGAGGGAGGPSSPSASDEAVRA